METIKVVIEIPEGSNLKYEYDESTGEFKLDFVFKDLFFPFSYGFIPQTLGGDGDPLDVIVLSSQPLERGTAVVCKAIGILKTIDRGEVDDKIIAVPIGDQLVEKYQDVADLPADTLQLWTEFYLEVAKQKKKVIEIKGFLGKEEAGKEIKNFLEMLDNNIF